MDLKYPVIFLCFFLLGLTPIFNTHEDKDQIDDEFRNAYLNFQPLQYRVVEATPTLTDLQDGEVVIFSSGAVKLMWRNLQEIYAVTGSCVTVRR